MPPICCCRGGSRPSFIERFVWLPGTEGPFPGCVTCCYRDRIERRRRRLPGRADARDATGISCPPVRGRASAPPPVDCGLIADSHHEEGKVRLGTSNVMVRCVSISQNTARIRVNGAAEEQELVLKGK